MAIRRVTGAVSPSELIFADANALGATYDGSGTTIERGETFTLPAAGTTAVSNGALRLEALKGDCTITNNGNSTLTNASGVDGTIVMRSGASDFPAFVRNSSMGSMSIPARESFEGSLLGAGTFDGTINSDATFPSGHIIQTVAGTKVTSESTTTNTEIFTVLSASITISAGNKVLIMISQNFRVYGASSSSGRYHYVRLRRGSDATLSNNTSLFRTGDDAVGMNGAGTGGFIYVAGITYVDDNPGAGTHQYRTTMVTTNSVYGIKSQAGGAESFMVLQEIKA